MADAPTGDGGGAFSVETLSVKDGESGPERHTRAVYGKITGSTTSVVYMQRALCPHSETMSALCLAPIVSVTYLKNASPRARRVGPCAIALAELSKPPSGSTSTCPSR